MDNEQAAARLRSPVARLAAAGLSERSVTRWFDVPLVTDARWVPGPPSRSRRGLGGWIALLVGGEEVAADTLGVLAPDELELLIDAGWVERTDGDRLRARVALLPLFGLLLVSARLDAAGDDAVGAPDVSALNVAASLPQLGAGQRLLDVGCGAGIVALSAARAGARVVGSDVDERALATARLNAGLNGLPASFVAADLFDGVGDDRFDVVTFNAPLLRAPLFGDGESGHAAPARYLVSPRGEALALEFLDGLPAHLAPHGEALVHAQLTPAVDERLDALAAGAQVVSLRFAHAPDGTPHALTCIRMGAPAGRRQLRVPLGPACAHLDRAIVDAALAPRRLAPDVTPLAAPWLELRESRVFARPGASTLRALTFGVSAIDADDLALLERLDGRPLGALGLDPDATARLARLADLGLAILR
jgi:SAM-dependent methyltransferase